MRRVQCRIAASFLMLALAACSRGPAQKTAEQVNDAAVSVSALTATAMQDAARACPATNTLSGTQNADFDGDGALDLFVDWSQSPCAANNPAVCSAAEGCVRQVWREGDAGAAPVYVGRAKAARLAKESKGASLVLDHSGTACGRPDSEICRVTYRWDARVKAMQEQSREIISTSAP